MVEQEDDNRKDHYNLAYILFYCMGTLTQVSSTFIPNAQLYWKYKFRDTDKGWDPNSKETTELQDEFTAHFTLVGSGTMIVALVLVITFARHWNIVYRMIGSLCAYIIMFLLITLFVAIDTDSWQNGFFYLTLLFLMLIACINAFYLVTLIQMCTGFSPIYLAAILSGQAICGIFAAAVQILTLALEGSPQTNGLVYFSVAVFCICVTFTAFLLSLNYSSFFQYHITKKKDEKAAKVEIRKELIYDILKRQKYIFGSMLFVLGVTIAVHPSITSTVQSVDVGNGHKWNDIYFVPVITYLMFNVCDLFGRELAIRIRKPEQDPVIFTCSVLRISITVLLLMCNLTAKHHTTVLFKSDAVYILLMIILATSNGYLTNICIVNLPKNFVDLAVEKLITIGLLVFIMILGGGVFAVIGVIIIKIL